ncbi:MAG: capsid protein [Cressdnaviricota sp.]|nr:MAG: capsid protein [Cressdnaviricota sp.]
MVRRQFGTLNMPKRQRLALNVPARSRSKSPWRSSAPAITTMSKFQPSRGIEKKYIDTTVTSGWPATTAATWSITMLNGVAQGQTDSTRIGQRTQMKSVQLRLTSPATVNQPVRVRVVYDKSTNLTAPVTGELFENDVQNAMNQNSTAGRFITLWDEILFVDNSNDAIHVEKFIKIDLPTVYGGTGATVGSIASGGLFLCLNHGGQSWASQPLASYSRVRFTDQ